MGWHAYMAFFKAYLQRHSQIAAILGKPLLLEEFNILLGYGPFQSIELILT